jgi:hypothetical protein
MRVAGEHRAAHRGWTVALIRVTISARAARPAIEAMRILPARPPALRGAWTNAANRSPGCA